MYENNTNYNNNKSSDSNNKEQQQNKQQQQRTNGRSVVDICFQTSRKKVRQKNPKMQTVIFKQDKEEKNNKPNFLKRIKKHDNL